MNHQSKHILVIRLSAMGDVAMVVPVLRALSQNYPGTRITVLTRGHFKSFFRNLHNVSVYIADVKGRHRGIFGLWRLSKELRELNIDVVADLHNVLRSKILKRFLYRFPFVQINKGRREKQALVSGKRFEALKSMHERYADVFRELGFELDLSRPIFPEPSKLDSKITELIGGDTRLIGIAPFAAFTGKMYPLELMRKVINEASKEVKVLLFGGGKKEIDLLNALASENNRVVNLAGKLSLDEELDVISNLDIMLAMDSANAHMAAMFNIPTITIWGITHPYAGFYPFNQPTENALLADRKQFPAIPTSVYGKTCPRGYEQAMRTIRPEAIIEKLKIVLGQQN